MKSFRISLRNVAAIVACLAAVTVFSGCDKEDDPDPSGDDAGYYNPLDGKYEKALRNVRINYSWQFSEYYVGDKTVQNGQVLACKGRLYIKEDDAASNDPKENVETFISTESPYKGLCVKAYSLVKNEWYKNELPVEYAGDLLTPGESFEWKGAVYSSSEITGNSGQLGSGYNGHGAGMLYKDRKADYWGKEVINEGTQSGIHLVEGLRIDVQEDAATIAGIKCTKYSCYAMSYMEQSGNIIQGRTGFHLWYSVWFDPETDIVMRFENWDYRNPEYNVWTGYIKYWFEINGIEFDKVKKEDIDTILNNYLSTHTPTDVSDDEARGSGW
jgi:hypothetical protein